MPLIKKAEAEEQIKKLLTTAFNDADALQRLRDHYKYTAALYNYSLMNGLLIAVQGGTIAQSFKGWRKVKRHVRKGEKARIWVYCPCIKEILTEPEPGQEPQPRRVLLGFRAGAVFDVSQTDGEPLQYAHNSADTAPIQYDALKAAVVAAHGVKVQERILSRERGYLSNSGITINEASNNADRVRTLIHELAHFLHGHLKQPERPRDAVEVEAEAATFLVLCQIGMSAELSAAYVANWNAARPDVSALKIFGVANKILKVIKTIQEGRA